MSVLRDDLGFNLCKDTPFFSPVARKNPMREIEKKKESNHCLCVSLALSPVSACRF